MVFLILNILLLSEHLIGVLPFSFAGFPNLQFYEAMEKEHKSKSKFSTPNYGLVTYPAAEWKIVNERDKSAEKDHNGQRRRIPDFELLLEGDQRKPKGQCAGLTKEEIIAIILYTGPMVSYSAHHERCC